MFDPIRPAAHSIPSIPALEPYTPGTHAQAVKMTQRLLAGADAGLLPQPGERLRFFLNLYIAEHEREQRAVAN